MKIQRNDKCPCGSGKKYKHCHLPIEQMREQQLAMSLARGREAMANKITLDKVKEENENDSTSKI